MEGTLSHGVAVGGMLAMLIAYPSLTNKQAPLQLRPRILLTGQRVTHLVWGETPSRD
jgi:hypothetical protein